VTPKAKRICTTIVFQWFKHVSASNQILFAFGAPHTCSLYFILEQSTLGLWQAPRNFCYFFSGTFV